MRRQFRHALQRRRRAYNVDFRFDGRNINVAAGGSYSFLYATFNPAAGAVAPGTYTFYNAALFGVPFDENGDAFTGPDGYDVTIVFDQTCPYPYSDTCAFTRTVEGVDAAVPEPSSWAMLITASARSAMRCGGAGSATGSRRRSDPGRPLKGRLKLIRFSPFLLRRPSCVAFAATIMVRRSRASGTG